MPQKPTYEELEKRIQELEQAEMARRRSEEDLAQIFSMSLDMICIADITRATFIKVNPAFTAILGHSKEALLNKPFLDFVHPDDIRPTRNVVEEKLKTGAKVINFENRYRCKDGSYRWLSWVSHPNPDQGVTYAIARDITRAKLIDKKLKESEKKYKNLFNASNDGICLHELIHENATPIDYRILDINEKYEQLTGIRRNQAIGVLASELYQTGEAPYLEIYSKVVATGIPTVFETYFPPLDKYFLISVFSPEKNQFATIFQDITNQKKLVQSLQESEGKYRRLAENSPDMIYRISLPHGHYEYVSPAAEPIFGYPPEAWYENPLLIKQIIHPDWHTYFREQWAKLVNGTVPPTYEYQIVHKNKEVKWIHQRNVAVKDKAGKLVAIEGIVTDMTDRKKAEEALVKKDAMLANIASQVPGMLYQFMMAADGRYAVPYSSEGVQDIFGCSPEEIQNDFTPILEVIHPDDRERLSRTIDDSAKNMSQWMLEYRVSIPGKPVKWVFGSSIPEKRRDGAIVWSGYNVEITELKQTETALRESKEQFRQFYQHLTIGVAVYEAVDDGEDFLFTDMNPTGQQQSKVHIDDIRGKRLTEVFPGVRDLGLLKALQDTWRTGKPRHVPFSMYKDNRITQWVENRIFKLPSGKIVAVYDDRTELVRLEEGLRQAQKLEAIGRLAGGVAHDFNNMLSIISGNAEMAIEDIDDQDPILSNLIEIQKAARRSADLTRQLLAFARKQTISPKVLDLNETIEGMLKMLRRLIGEDIDLAWRPKPELWQVKIDPSQIDQILANLCVNARDAIKGVGKVTIETGNAVFDEEYCSRHEGFKPGEYVMLGVSDNGCGITRDAMDNLFEPFFTTKDFGQGTGLGLSTVYGIIKQNDGFINVYSELEKGTTFKLYLPQYAHHLKQKNGVSKKEIVIGGMETILLVEDEEAILNMSRVMLERLGYTVISVSGPLEALRIAQSYPEDIHLLMTDVVMPEMNGRDLAEKLSIIYPDIKCLFMSGYTANVIAHHGVLDEGIQFINKPFVKNDLGKKVRQTLDRENGDAPK